jgi:hypothetical protein
MRRKKSVLSLCSPSIFKSTNLKVNYQFFNLSKHLTLAIDLVPTSLHSSSSIVEKWLTNDFLDTSVYPQKSDYYIECFKFKTSLTSLQMQINLHKVCFLVLISTSLAMASTHKVKYHIVKSSHSYRFSCKYTHSIMGFICSSL